MRRRRSGRVECTGVLRLDASVLDYAILTIYFLVVLGTGLVVRLSAKTDVDSFLSGRSLPAWVTGLAFVAANLGGLEILGMVAGFLGAFGAHLLHTNDVVVDFGSDLAASLWGAGIAFGVDLVVTVVVSLVTRPKPEEELRGLVWGLKRKERPDPPQEGDEKWWRSIRLLGGGALAPTVILNVLFI